MKKVALTQKQIVNLPKNIAYIKSNWETLSNGEMAKTLGVYIQTVREKCYELGLYRMRLEYWTSKQINFLKKKFHTCGDLELAEIFQKKWPKKKGWTLKHIEKKRMYLGLKRTKEELFNIKQKAKAKGVYVLGLQKTWMKRGAVPEGTVVIWATDTQWPTQWIKINGKYTQYNRYLWHQAGRRIPKGKVITLKPGRTEIKSVEDLECVTKAELSRRNGAKAHGLLSDNYVASIMSFKDPDLRKYLKENPSLLNLKRLQLQLQRKLSQLQIN